MSIQGEIGRLSAAKASIAASLQAMGVDPPSGTTLEQYAAQLAAIAAAAPWLSLTGGTMTGPIVLNGPPTDENHAANKQYVDEHAGARVILGSYVGTGTHGASNPNHITLAEPFKLLCIYGIQHTDSYTSISDSDICNIIPSSIIPTEYTSGFGFGMGYNYNPRDTYGKKSADGKTFSWYYDLSPSGAESVQFNQSGTVYHYYAIV